MVINKKIQLYICGDKDEVNRGYKYLKNGIYNQSRAMNLYISDLFLSKAMEMSKEDREEINKLYSRISTSKKGSAYPKDIEFAKGLSSASDAAFRVRKDFDKAIKDGLLYGKVSLPTYSLSYPLLVSKEFITLRRNSKHDDGFYHMYESDDVFFDKLYTNDCDVYIKFVNGITFKVVLGTLKKSMSLRRELEEIFKENHKICGSSISLKTKNKRTKIFLNLSIDVPEQTHELDENIVVGVDLGIAVPAVCALNNNPYKKIFLGDKDNFLYTRTSIQNQRQRLQRAMRFNSGGHGRKKKLKKLECLKEKERNFAQTYNHTVARKIVEFAINNHAKYINLEHLKGINTDQTILRNWSYFELQSFIKYKAAMNGIVVRFVEPAYTSQTCSKCGNLEEGQRLDQSHFVCKKCGAEMNADYNAARNIAMSTKFVEENSKNDEEIDFECIKNVQNNDKNEQKVA